MNVGVQSNSQEDLMAGFGVDPFRVPVDQLYGALAEGKLDCAIGGLNLGNYLKWYEVTDQLLNMFFGLDFYAHIVNLDIWNSLDEETRDLLDPSFLDVEREFWALVHDRAEAGFECNTVNDAGCPVEMAVGNMTLDQLREEDYDALRETVRMAVIPRWLERCGSHCADIFNQTIARVVGIDAGPATEPVPVVAAEAASTQYGGELQLAADRDPFANGFWPYDNLSIAKFQLNNLIFSRLFRRDPGTGEIVGDLVEGWGVSDDLREWTLWLRQDARFLDGGAVTASDVVASLEYVQASPTTHVRGLRDNLQKVDVIDDFTVKVVFQQPFAPFLDVLATSPVAVVVRGGRGPI